MDTIPPASTPTATKEPDLAPEPTLAPVDPRDAEIEALRADVKGLKKRVDDATWSLQEAADQTTHDRQLWAGLQTQWSNQSGLRVCLLILEVTLYLVWIVFCMGLCIVPAWQAIVHHFYGNMMGTICGVFLSALFLLVIRNRLHGIKP